MLIINVLIILAIIKLFFLDPQKQQEEEKTQVMESPLPPEIAHTVLEDL